MTEAIIEFDKWLFLIINHGLSNSLFDWLMPVLRDKTTWTPFYILLFGVILWKFRLNGLIAAAFVGIAVGLCDYTSSSIVKPFFDRLRPCNDPVFSEQVRLLISCGPGKAFTSSHATNHFGLAMILSLLFGRAYKWVIPVSFTWAFFSAGAQVYVGVHYPMDFLGGAILGCLISLLVWRGYRLIPEHYRIDTERLRG